MSYDSLLEVARINDYSGKDITLAYFGYLISSECLLVASAGFFFSTYKTGFEVLRIIQARNRRKYLYQVSDYTMLGFRIMKVF